MVGEIAKTMIRIPWMLSVAGLRQVTQAVFPDSLRQIPAGLSETAYTAFRATENRFEQLLIGALAMSDNLSRGSAFELLQEVTAAADGLAPGEASHLVWQELHNKLEAFGTFEYVESVLHLSTGLDRPLPELVELAGALEPYRSVWATEGLGHSYAEERLRQSHVPQDILTAPHLETLPARSLITLHAGMGLPLARHTLSSLSVGSTRSEIRETLYRFLESCRQNARPGYTEIAVESLGLVGRTLYPQLVSRLDQALSSIDIDLVALFWHGVGRGLYFLPVNFMPYVSSAGRAIAMALREAPHRIGRLNAVSGVAWPFTLVNIRHPQIMEDFLREGYRLIAGSDAFAQGISTAILTWHDSVPDDPALHSFLGYQPKDKTLAARWKEQIRTPCDSALQRYYPVMKTERRLGELFRYQSLSRLVGRLEQEKSERQP